MKPARYASALAAAALLASAAIPARAAFPEKPIRLIVPFPAGGPTDAMARLMSQKAAPVLGQQIVVDNIGGAGGVIAAETAARAPADGYTLFFATTGTIAINPTLYANARYAPEKDFMPVTLVATSANVLLVHPSVPAHNVRELIRFAKANPGKLMFGSAGNGSSNHLSGELLKSMTGIDIVHVPYKGTAAATTDLLSGRLPMMFDTIITGMPHVAAGKLRALGVTGTARSEAAPGVPTIAESGIPGFDVTIWFGVVAPAGVKEPVSRLNQDIVKAVSTPDTRARFAALGADVSASTPEQFGQRMRADIAKWSKVVKESGARID